MPHNEQRMTTSLLHHLAGRLRIAVVHGGNRLAENAVIYPTRNPRSEKTYEVVARDIADSLTRLGFCDVALMPEDMNLGERLRRHGTDLAWLNTGGTQGYVSVCHASAMLELMGMPYIGHNPLNAAMLDYKHVFKHELDRLGIATPRSIVWGGASNPESIFDDRHFHRVFMDDPGPFIVKPVSGRASQHVYLAEDRSDLPEKLQKVFAATENLVLIEEFIEGPEYTIGVCGPSVYRQQCLERRDDPLTFSALERVMAPDEKIFTSMDVRPIALDRIRLLDPTTDNETVSRLSQIAQTIYNELGLETAVRVDVRSNCEGRFFVLEANPKPDLAYPKGDKINLICAGLSLLGMEYDDLIMTLLANRLSFLLAHRMATIPHIVALLG